LYPPSLVFEIYLSLPISLATKTLLPGEYVLPPIFPNPFLLKVFFIDLDVVYYIN
jgi:hypothetical protein